MSINRRTDGLVDGVVVSPDCALRHVRVQEELLILSAEPWLDAHAQRYRRCAEKMALVGDSDDAATIVRDLASATRLVADSGWLEDAGAVWPEVARRAALPEWHVNDAAEAQAYARRLVSQDVGGAERVEWVYGIGEDGGWGLILPPRLSRLLAYVGPYVVGTLSAEEDLAGFVEIMEEARVA